MISAAVRRNALYSAIFSAGLGSGVGGSEALHAPAYESAAQVSEIVKTAPMAYVAAGIVEVITAPCEDAKQVGPCEQLRNWQLGQVIDDLKPDVSPRDQFALSKLDLYVSERITFDDVVKEIWVQEALVVLNARLADGYARQDISPDDTLSGEALIAMLEAARDA